MFYVLYLPLNKQGGYYETFKHQREFTQPDKDLSVAILCFKNKQELVQSYLSINYWRQMTDDQTLLDNFRDTFKQLEADLWL